MGPVIDVSALAQLDDPSCIHHHDVVTVLGHHAEIMGDQDDGRFELVLQPVDEVQDLGLNGHVQGSRGLVGNQEVRVQRKGHGDHGPLAHSAAELMRILPGPLLRPGDPNQLKEIDGLLDTLFLGGAPVGLEDLGDLIPNTVDGVEGRQGVLKDHADLGPPDVAHLLGRKLQEVLAPEEHLAADPGLSLGDQTQHREEGHTLAGPGLAHDPQSLARGNEERDSVDCLYQAVLGWEVDLEIFDLEERFRQGKLQSRSVQLRMER